MVRASLGAMLLLAAIVPGAVAQQRTKPNIHFFSGEQSAAHWTPKESSDADRMSIELQVGPTVGSSFAGFVLNRVEGTPPPEREPYFFHKEDRAGPSGGSPRLVLHFGGGNNIQLRPDNWLTGWTKVGEGDGDGNWDVSGGICGFRYDVTYQEALACHPGALLQSVFLVTDSNWLYQSGYTNWVDQLQYDGHVFSHARDNSNSDR